MYQVRPNPDAWGTATYNTSSLSVSSGTCTWTFGIAFTTKNVEISSGIYKINATVIDGPADPCYACSNFAYWYLWSAVGIIAWVPLSTSQSEPCNVQLFIVTQGSNLEKGNFTAFEVVRDNVMSAAGPDYGTGSYTKTQVTLTGGPCKYVYKELVATTVTITSPSSAGPALAPATVISMPATSSSAGPIPAPSTAVTATPAPITSQFQVKLSLLLQVSLANFTASMQQTLREQMAVTAGLTKADAGRVALSFRAARRRRLLAESVAVDVTISMPDASSASKAAGLLTPAAISLALSSANLPAATVTSTAAATGAAAALSPMGGKRLVPVAALVAGLAALAGSAAARA